MKKIYFGITVLGLCLLAACSNDDDEYIGSDNIITESRDLSSFENIDNGSIINTTINYGEAQSVEVTANDNIMDRIITDVVNNTLIVNLKDGNYNNVSINVNITIPEIMSISNEGTGNIDLMGFDALSEISIESVGTGNVSAVGKASKLEIELTGTGNFDGFDFMTSVTDATLTGTGNIEIFCSEELKGSLTGTGSIYYKGEPSINVSITGVGEVINAN